MPKYLLILSISAAALMLLLGLGCEDRGSGIPVSTDGPYDPYEDWGIDPLADHSYDKDLALQLRNTDEMWLGSMYIPRASMPPPWGQGKKAPVVILLPPQDGDKFHFFKAGLFELAEQMISSGEIQPMYIFCPSNTLAFGGFFYGNSMPAGRVDSIIGDRMISWLHTNYPNIDPRASKTGIGGVGMGAYGAFRAALKHPGVFKSVTVTDGPLDFDGPTDATGLLPLFDDAIAEQLTLTRYQYPDSIFSYKRFDSGDAYVSLQLSRLFIGGALAFSPHDTLVDFDYNEYRDYVIHSKDTIADSATLITDVVHREYGEPSDIEFDFDFHLPFDDTTGTGTPTFQPSPVIWPLWMRNNLDSLYVQAGGDPLSGVKMWIATNADAKWNYAEMTESWLTTLTETFSCSVEVHRYGSFGSEPITEDEYLYDLLREMLIFHSASVQD